MLDQKRITTQNFHTEDMLKLIGNNPLNKANANLNMVSGPAKSIYLDGKLVSCGGIRVDGIDEAWVCYHPEALKHLGDVLRHSRDIIEEMGREKSLWRLWAEISKDDKEHKTFMEHMKFNQVQAWCRLL